MRAGEGERGEGRQVGEGFECARQGRGGKKNQLFSLEQFFRFF